MRIHRPDLSIPQARSHTLRTHPVLGALPGRIILVALCVFMVGTSHAQMELCGSPLPPTPSTMAWNIRVPVSGNWFARIPGEPSYRVFNLGHIDTTHHRAIADALHSIFGDLATSVRIRVTDGISNGDRDRAFVYRLSFDRITAERLCLDMDFTASLHRRLCAWMATVGNGTIEPTGICLLNVLSSIDVRCDDSFTSLDHRPLDVRYSDGQLMVMNDDVRTLPLTVFTIRGEIIIQRTTTPGRNIIDLPFLPSGSYLVKLGERSGRYVIHR